MATARDCHILVTYFMQQYASKYGHRPNINRNKARWNFDGMLYDLDIPETKALIDYYLEADRSSHSIDWFFNNYEALIERKRDTEQDELDRARLRAESKQRVEAWKIKNGNT